MSIESRIEDELRGTPEVDIDVSFDMPLSATHVYEAKKKMTWMCSCCGKQYKSQSGHFPKSSSPLYQANNGFVNICTNCRDAYVLKLLEFYKGNVSASVKRFCEMFDLPFSTDVLAYAMNQTGVNNKVVGEYIKQANLRQNKLKFGATYTDGLRIKQIAKNNEVILSKSDAIKKETEIKTSSFEKWGYGLMESDYDDLNMHYKLLKKNNPNADSNQEIFIKALCKLNLLANKAMINGDSTEYAKLIEQYSKTFSKAGLKTVEEKDNSADLTFGVTLATISQYTPEEFYKDKKLYEDYDSLGEYLERHVYRPMKNLLVNDDERDKEYFVPEDDGYE